MARGDDLWGEMPIPGPATAPEKRGSGLKAVFISAIVLGGLLALSALARGDVGAAGATWLIAGGVAGAAVLFGGGWALRLLVGRPRSSEQPKAAMRLHRGFHRIGVVIGFAVFAAGCGLLVAPLAYYLGPSGEVAFLIALCTGVGAIAYVVARALGWIVAAFVE
jgi:hypothetical protein